MKRGKKYQESVKLVDKTKLYDPVEAMELVQKTAKAKFDETVEAHIRLGVDSRHADQQVRGAVVLPHGTGKKVRVLVFAKGEKATEAEKAGADYVGAEELVSKIQNENWFEFDVVVATPDMMGVVGRLGKVLGPKGLMPNPKAGTVTMEEFDSSQTVTVATALVYFAVMILICYFIYKFDLNIRYLMDRQKDKPYTSRVKFLVLQLSFSCMNLFIVYSLFLNNITIF